MHDTIPARIFDQARRRPNAPAHAEKIGGAWVVRTWSAYADDVRRATKSLLKLGFQPKDTVGILGFNRREWVIFDVAAMCAGGAPAGIYTTSSAEETKYILGHAESPVALVENEAQWRKIESVMHELPKLRWIVAMRGAAPIDHPKVVPWEAFLELGREISDRDFEQRLLSLEPQGLATLIYTSGTTGPPKGVMLSHANLSFTATLAQRLVGGHEGERCLSYLPLSHIAEQVFTIHGPATQGSMVYFAESIEKLPANLKEAKPTLFFGVPRIWEKLHAGISQKLAEAKGARRALVDEARKVGKAMSACRAEGRAPDAWLRARHALFDRLVFSKLKAAIGLDATRIAVSGAAPVAREIIEFFAELDILIHEVYGQSEDTGPTSFNTPGATRFGTVGRAVPGVEVKIADDEEILVRGPNVFLGYYKEPQATAETLDGDWLKSGDLGKVDADGYLAITGRKKEIIITAGGKNISPKNIEEAIKNHPIVGEVVVIGDRRKFLTALVTLEPEAAARFLEERGERGDPTTSPLVRAEIQATIDRVNATLARVETVKRFFILSKPFSLDHGELTPTLKVKRKIVHQRYAQEIESMYAGADDA